MAVLALVEIGGVHISQITLGLPYDLAHPFHELLRRHSLVGVNLQEFLDGFYDTLEGSHFFAMLVCKLMEHLFNGWFQFRRPTSSSANFFIPEHVIEVIHNISRKGCSRRGKSSCVVILVEPEQP